MTYKEYCEAIVHAGKTTVTIVTRACEGWYRASKDILAPAIQEKIVYAIASMTAVISALSR